MASRIKSAKSDSGAIFKIGDKVIIPKDWPYKGEVEERGVIKDFSVRRPKDEPLALILVDKKYRQEKYDDDGYREFGVNVIGLAKDLIKQRKWKFSKYCDLLTEDEKRRAISEIESRKKKNYKRGQKIYHAIGTGKVLAVELQVNKGGQYGGNASKPGLHVYLCYKVKFDSMPGRPYSSKTKWIGDDEQFNSKKEYDEAEEDFLVGE